MPGFFTSHSKKKWPYFDQLVKNQDFTPNLTHSEMIEQVNNQIIKQVKELQYIGREFIQFQKIGYLSDAYITVKNISSKKGIEAHIQVNNIPDKDYHRSNGFSRFNTISTIEKLLAVQFEKLLESVRQTGLLNSDIKGGNRKSRNSGSNSARKPALNPNGRGPPISSRGRGTPGSSNKNRSPRSSRGIGPPTSSSRRSNLNNGRWAKKQYESNLKWTNTTQQPNSHTRLF